ncbi:MAG TPA: hypothetical protein VJJ82_00670 [Candidatus Nanoarchaeia archaeon]|nr:hypothetical protein [Candidatus Nanoarchaeia archaeon]
MGRVKTQLIRRLTFEVIEQAAEANGKTFAECKKVASEYMPTASKKIRNSVAGYAARLARIKPE